MNPLSQSLSRKGNNFDLVRLLAAFAVIYGHSYLLQASDGSSDWVGKSLGFDGFGSFGVYAFFMMSGILVTASFDRQRSASRFIALRIARIWPAVAAGSLVVIFIIGPIFTTVPLHEYFNSSATWINLDNFSTIVLRNSWGPHNPALYAKTGWGVPGVFANNPFPYDICSPLWTLPLEVRCYVLVLIAGLAGLLSSRWGVTLAAALGLLAFVVRVHLPHLEIGLRDFSSKPGGYSFWPEPFFLIGMLLYGWRERIEFYGLGALGLLMVFMVFRDTAGAQPLFYLAFVYGVMWIGTTPLLHRFVPRNDYSYGLYIYGFMMQQCVASIAPHLSHQMALLVGAPFMYGCAALSWHFVERPALAWCRRRMALPPRSLAVPMRTDTAVR